MIILRALVLTLALAWATAPVGANELCDKSSAAVTAEIEGLGAPDAKFVIASADTASKGLIEQITKGSSIGDQGSSNQLAQARSTGCSTGCSVGCSTGCSNGCSNGCSMGCR